MYSRVLCRIGGTLFYNMSRYSRFSTLAPRKMFYKCSDFLMCGPRAQCTDSTSAASAICSCSGYLAGGPGSLPYDLTIGCKGFAFSGGDLEFDNVTSLTEDLSSPGVLVVKVPHLYVGINDSTSSNAHFFYLSMSESTYNLPMDYFSVAYTNDPAAASTIFYNFTWQPIAQGATSSTYRLLFGVDETVPFWFTINAYSKLESSLFSLTPARPVLICPPGSIPRADYSTCDQCTSGSYQFASTLCAQCPSDFPHSDPGSSDVSFCVASPGLLTIVSNGVRVAETCPISALCLEQNTTVQSVVLRQGYWRALDTSTTIIACLHPAYCWGGNDSTRWVSINGQTPCLPGDLATGCDSSPNETSSSSRRMLQLTPTVYPTTASPSLLFSYAPTPNFTILVGTSAYCRPGHTGPLCESCDAGFYLIKGQGCALCDSAASSPSQVVLQLFIILIIVLVGAAAFLLYQKWQMAKMRERGVDKHDIKARLSEWVQVQLVKFKILLGLVQVASSFGITFGAIYPTAILQLLSRYWVNNFIGYII